MAIGRKTGGGSRKGSPNKATRTLKEMIIGALDQNGGQAWLAKKANEHPAAFMSLIGRVLPLQVTGEGGGAIVVRWEREGRDGPDGG